MDSGSIQAFLRQTSVLRSPQKRLSTFGATWIDYHLISPVDELRDRTRLRQGRVRSEKPLILTAESFTRRFEGFGEEAAEFARYLGAAYRDLMRALEYNFKNEGFAAQVISEPPQAVTDRVLADVAGRGGSSDAVVRCPDSAWSLALMKLTLDESARSFPVNVRDLERRGLFDPETASLDRRRREVESLFADAAADPGARDALGAKLRESGLFPEYEDRFLALF